ncbi:hypothetical protein K402DRAFT_232505 [Aulographum hederae CBS 113979]|uniref:Serine hydrolase domain-containing protein n=1 Tax=Aulographum hederae CBS 113979 TaxID=1176131 RepID=A0A6G1GKY4_9PEZI|nr:hypothetical protein K402DRAFT_232505 [Aulographum hederae CBS 113979]
MRLLCLHGRGSNNDIFRMQTAGFRSLLDDFEFEFVQGQMPHVEGNWSLHTTDFADSKLWGYFNMLDPPDVLKTERELLELVEEDGPFDGILGYSQGGTLAAQMLVRHFAENPKAGVEEMPFRFAIFFNTATPSHVFEMKEEVKPVDVSSLNEQQQADAALFYDIMKRNPLLGKTPFYPAQLANGRGVLTDGKLGMVKCDTTWDGQPINMPTLHVRCPQDKEDHGEGTYKLCNPDLAEQYFHSHMHDFPRGYDEMRTIAKLIRKTADKAV